MPSCSRATACLPCPDHPLTPPPTAGGGGRAASLLESQLALALAARDAAGEQLLRALESGDVAAAAAAQAADLRRQLSELQVSRGVV